MASSAFGSTATLQQIVTYFQATLPNILICRFLMNLHHSDDSSDDTSTSQLQSSGMPTTSLGFSSRLASRVVGNMGATLDHGSFSLTTTDDRGGLDSDMDISTSHDEDRAGSDGVEDIMQVQ
ncbi:hypothetical protein AcW2_005398 [Taiwanofungus camphoratus]|nr:hypothetical protein AcW2_005398 [Antrodia cinnamomea]